MENRVKLEQKTPEKKIIEYEGIQIEVIPFIGFSEQALLINNYIEDYFVPTSEKLITRPSYNIFEAECRLKNYIMQLNTNLDLSIGNNDIYVDDMLWERITNVIENYFSFKHMLNIIVRDLQEEERFRNSSMHFIEELVKKAMEFIEQISNVSPEDIEKMRKDGLDLIERLEKSSILNNPADKKEIGI